MCFKRDPNKWKPETARAELFDCEKYKNKKQNTLNGKNRKSP